MSTSSSSAARSASPGWSCLGRVIHADRHGAVVIPHEVAREVAKAAELCARREEPILKVARSPDFSLEALERAMAEAAEIH